MSWKLNIYCEYVLQKGQAYRGRFGVIKKPLKTNLNRQRRQDLRNKRVLSPRLKSSAKGNMDASTENQETVQETGEQVIKNGPEGCTSSDEVKEKVHKFVCFFWGGGFLRI